MRQRVRVPCPLPRAGGSCGRPKTHHPVARRPHHSTERPPAKERVAQGITCCEGSADPPSQACRGRPGLRRRAELRIRRLGGEQQGDEFPIWETPQRAAASGRATGRKPPVPAFHQPTHRLVRSGSGRSNAPTSRRTARRRPTVTEPRTFRTEQRSVAGSRPRSPSPSMPATFPTQPALILVSLRRGEEIANRLGVCNEKHAVLITRCAALRFNDMREARYGELHALNAEDAARARGSRSLATRRGRY